MDRGAVNLLRVFITLLLLGCSPVLYAWDAKIPFLKDVAATQPTAVDGIWRLAVNNARIRIKSGRAYALDPWIYLLLWKVKPEMVVMRNFREVSAGKFAGDDLLLAGPATLKLINPDELRVQVQGALGPATYKFLLVQADDPQALQTAWGGAPLGSDELPGDVTPPSTETPATQPPQQENYTAEAVATDCESTAVDPDSGMTVCL